MDSNVKNKTSSRHVRVPGQQNHGATDVRQQVFSARRGGQERDQEKHTAGLGWGGIHGQRVWHATYAGRREALRKGIGPHSGCEDEEKATSRKGKSGKGGKGGRAAKRQRASREMAVASGGLSRRGRRRCTGHWWLQARGGRPPFTVRFGREIAYCRSSENAVQFFYYTCGLFDCTSMH